VVCGGFMVTNSEIIPSEERMLQYSQYSQATLADTGLNSAEQEALEKRFLSTGHGSFYYSFIILIVAFLVAKNTVFFLLIKFMKILWANTLGLCIKPIGECNAHCFY
jgi:hypothetical protein